MSDRSGSRRALNKSCQTQNEAMPIRRGSADRTQCGAITRTEPNAVRPSAHVTQLVTQDIQKRLT